MKLTFWKYQGAGNDFVMIDNRDLKIKLSPEEVAALCDRHTGIGGDGLMLIEPHSAADFYMRYYNSDGSEAGMCGNGGRCIALFAHQLGIGGDMKFFCTLDGEHEAKIIEFDGKNGVVAIGLIDVTLINDKSDTEFFLNSGVPHFVKFTDSIADIDVANEGREIRYRDEFQPSGGTNVNFVEHIKDGHIALRTYERGVEAETLACGTGATASAIATHHHHSPNINSYWVHVLGGILRVTFDYKDGIYSNVILEGAASMVFKGEI